MDRNIWLRDIRTGDASALYTMCLDEKLRKSGVQYYASVCEAESVINAWNSSSGECVFKKAVIEAETGCMVGIILLSDMNRYNGYCELEYAIAPESRSKGYAAQAVSDIIQLAFESGKVEVIAAWVRSHNAQSSRVLEKCGFVFEGRLRKHARDKSDTLCYSITLDD